jgi:hypothetical protein
MARLFVRSRFLGSNPEISQKSLCGSARLTQKEMPNKHTTASPRKGESLTIKTILSKFLNLPHHWPNHYPLHLLHLCPVSIFFATSLDTYLATHLVLHISVHSTGYIPGHISVMFTMSTSLATSLSLVTTHISSLIGFLATPLAESP